MRNKTPVVVLFLVLLLSCYKTSVLTSDIFNSFLLSSHRIYADGTTQDTIYVVLNKDADPTKRNILFKASGGKFINGKDSTISVPAQIYNGQLAAKAILIAPLQPQKVKITVQTDQSNIFIDYSLKDSIEVDSSLPVSIGLIPSSFGLKANFGSEVKITGILKNASGNYVSLNTKVKFTDTLISTGMSGVGSFRATQDMSDSISTVSTNYSIPNLPVGSTIKITATVVGTSISDSIIITTI
jgi:hypothetical protein